VLAVVTVDVAVVFVMIVVVIVVFMIVIVRVYRAVGVFVVVQMLVGRIAFYHSVPSPTVMYKIGPTPQSNPTRAHTTFLPPSRSSRPIMFSSMNSRAMGWRMIEISTSSSNFMPHEVVALSAASLVGRREKPAGGPVGFQSAPRRTRTFNQLIKSQLLYH
jgi:hypothetical protein